MIQKKTLLSLFLVIFLISLFSGCDKIDELKVRLGMKNNDFEYIKQGKIKKIVIQSTRDPGFRFIVTDKNAISELYDILSQAKPVQAKSALEPDYIFEMEEGINKVYKFNYIAGLDKKDAGNLYSDDKIYIVSKRIDNDIIKNFWNVRKPNDFNEVYYGTLLSQIEQYSQGDGKGKSIGINIYDDVEAAKFILSTDLEEFKSNLSLKVNNAELIEPSKTNGQTKVYDVTMSIRTVGYKTFLYKCEITFWDNTNKSEKKYYIQVSDNFKDGRWNTKVYTENDKPSTF
nr:hypothetical protein [Clostridium caldaquaticum]